MKYSDIAASIRNWDNILIHTHRNPDGDTIGSAAALCSALRRAGKTAYLRTNKGFTKKFLAFMEVYVQPDDFEPDYRISVDCATEGMLDGFEGKIDFSIDHHPTNTFYAENNIVEDKKAACAEAVYDLILALTGNVTPEEATLLYIGVSTDTGCFQYSNTNSDTFICASRLLEAGADNVRVNTMFFRKVSPARMRLETLVYGAMKYYYDSKVVISFITKDMISQSGAQPEDMDDLANLATRTEGSCLCVTIKETDEGTSKVSVRSSDGVSSIAVCEPFGGGGHFNASGCSISCSPYEAEEKLLEVIKGVI